MADLTTKQASQRAMILAVKEPKDYYDVRETSFRYTLEDYQVMVKLGLVKEILYRVVKKEERKLVFSWEEGHKYVTSLHYLTHLGAKKLKGVVNGPALVAQVSQGLAKILEIN
jgi:DNA-directed RNA polymerase subunit F